MQPLTLAPADRELIEKLYAELRRYNDLLHGEKKKSDRQREKHEMKMRILKKK